MPLPRVQPLELGRAREPFDHADWLFELKHDGFRALAFIQDGKCELVSRRGITYKSYAPLCSELPRALDVRDAVLDGELVCLDGNGRSQFRDMLPRRRQPIFYVFDVLYLNGTDLRALPLLNRAACEVSGI